MKKVKKTLSFVLAVALLVTACLTDGFGVFAGVNANGETEIDVTKVYSGHNDTLITFKLSATDYSTAEINGVNLDANEDNEDYNFWTNIKIYTGETKFKRLKETHLESELDHRQKWYNMWGRLNEISIQLGRDTYNAATKIVIPAGTVFPSFAYTNNGSPTKGGYVTTTDLEFIKPATVSGETTWVKKVDTNVRSIEIADASGKLFFRLSESDYKGKGQTFIDQTKLKEYQFLDMIEVYQDETTHAPLSDLYTSESYYDLYGRDEVIAVDLKDGWDGNSITKIVIKAGCQFPSYSYTNGGSEEKIGYVVKADTTFTTTTMAINNATWTRNSAPTEEIATGINKIQVRGKEARLFIFPTVSDYGSAAGNTPISLTKIKDYNLLDNIVVYKSDDVHATLRELCINDENHYNYWGESSCIALDMDDSWNGTTVKKIEFKAGCQFPSYSYTHRGSYDNVAYTLQEDLVYVTNTSIQDNTDWTLVSTPEDTAVTGVKSGHNEQMITFTLSASDYTAFGNVGGEQSDYSFWNDIKLYTSETDSQTLGTAYKEGGQKYYNMWEMANSVSIQVNETTYNSLTKIVIPAGTVFPSQAFTSGSTQKKGGFKTTKDITFVKPEGAVEKPNVGYEWEVYEEPANIDTTISKIQVRGKVDEKGYLFVFLGTHDYSGASANEYVADHFDEYNILSKIELFTETDQKLLSEVIDTDPTTKEPATYRRYGEDGSISFKLADGWNGKTIKKISIKQGAEFPSYRYTNGSATSKKAYVLPDDITYTTPASEWSNEQWNEYVEPVEHKTEITNIHVRSGFVLLFLSNHDYAEAGQTQSIGTKLSEYNLTDSITITTADGTTKLSEILEDEQYYNIWIDTGCVALEMKGGYNGTTIKKVAIKKGAEFPSYNYTSGATKTKTSYVIEKDYVFNTGNTTETDNTVWTKVTPYSSETNVTAVALSGSTLTFNLSESDYVSGAVGSNHTDFDYWKNVRVYTSDKEYVSLSTWADSTRATYGKDALSLTGSSAIVRVVIPAKTVFPSYKYTSGQIGECVGYYVPGEVVFENQDGTWTNVSVGISNVSGDVNGDNKVNSQDLVAMAKYAKNGYGYNASSLTYDKTQDEAGNRHIVRRVILGDVLHNYEKESDNLTYFSSSDLGLDSFLNDFYKRQIGYIDYVEGDMTVNSYKPGTHVDGVYNMGWTTTALTWADTTNSMESDRLAGQKQILEDVIVDDYNYVWAGKDTVEDPSKNMLTNGAERTMEWPFPNATLTDGGARFWEFHANTSKQDTDLSKWDSNIGATITDGLYQGTATKASKVEFWVKDGGINTNEAIINTQYAPWLAIDLRMNTADYANIADVQVSFTTSSSSTASYTTVKASEVAALKYEYTEDYAHELWFPMYQNTDWIGTDGAGTKIYQLKIEIIPKTDTTLSGTFALNYVRPSFDTRDPNTNGTYISSLKQYFDYTGDKTFLNNNIAKARKAMELYMAMYNNSRNLIDRSYFYGHKGQNNLAFGVDNGYWDTLYKPVYDFETNMYFYQALKDLAEMEEILGNDASTLKSKANAVLTAMRKNVSAGGFYNESTGRFAAGKNYNDATVDYGYTTWNLQAIELGIATDAQAQSIMNWLDGTSNLYYYEFAPRTATVNDNGIYGWLAANKLSNVYDLGYGNDVQFGGAIMYTSYYDLTSRIQVNGADNALGRLKGIQSWYSDVSAAYKSSSESVKNFYLPYFEGKGVTMQNGTRETGNGAVGIDGEFTESLLVAAAIPYGFFGMDSEGGNTLCVTPNLPSTMDHWKVENMQYNGVTYDLSTYKDAVRIDSVRGTTTGLSVKVTLDCPAGKDIYVDGVAKNVTRVDGKATVTVPFGQTLVEVK